MDGEGERANERTEVYTFDMTDMNTKRPAPRRENKNLDSPQLNTRDPLHAFECVAPYIGTEIVDVTSCEELRRESYGRIFKKDDRKEGEKNKTIPYSSRHRILNPVTGDLKLYVQHVQGRSTGGSGSMRHIMITLEERYSERRYAHFCTGACQ